MPNKQMKTLTINGETFDVVDEVARQSGGGLTEDVKQALLDCFENVAWINNNGQTYYQALVGALYSLDSIEAVFTQGSAVVYDTDTLDSLKTYLVVTANYENGTSATVTNYTLSGTLTEGTSVITVGYGGETDTFTVTVTASGLPSAYTAYDYISANASKQPSDLYITTPVGGRLNLKSFSNLQEISVEFDLLCESNMRDGSCIFGRRTASGSGTSYAFYASKTNSSVGLGYHLHGVDSNPSLSGLTLNQITHLTLDNPSASPSTLSDGTNSVSIAWVNNNAISNVGFCLFTNPYDTTSNMSISKYYQLGELKMYDLNNNLVGDYLPCVRNSDNRIGMYDLVSKEFYTTSIASYSTIGNSDNTYAVGNWS